MKRDELPELHYITPIRNVPSILRLGLLSYRRAQRLNHESVADETVQLKRADKNVPGGQRLHDYVNLSTCVPATP